MSWVKNITLYLVIAITKHNGTWPYNPDSPLYLRLKMFPGLSGEI